MQELHLFIPVFTNTGLDLLSHYYWGAKCLCILRVSAKGMFLFLQIAARSCSMRFMRFSVYEWHTSGSLRRNCWSKGRCNMPSLLRHGWENSWTSKSYRIQAQKNDSIQFPLLLFYLLSYTYVKAEFVTDYQRVAENPGLENSVEHKTNTRTMTRAKGSNNPRPMVYYCLIGYPSKYCHVNLQIVITTSASGAVNLVII